MTDSIPRYALSKGISRIRSDAYWGSLSCLRYRDTERPAMPNEEWARVRTIYGGICGSDISTITLHNSMSMTAFTSFPFTLGHENVGIISELGEDVSGFQVGDRVVVDPLLSFEPRGIDVPPGVKPNHADIWDQGALAPGTLTGFCRDTGGSWSEEFIAHRSQLVAVPDDVTDEEAVLAEPFAVSIHAVLKAMPDDDDTVLIIGGGIIGLCTIAALRGLGSKCRIVMLARYPFQADEAKRLGADVVLGKTKGEKLERKLVEALGARTLKPIMGPQVVVGGADVVYDCVGARASVEQALRFAATGGTVVMVGLASNLDGIDWTPLWMNELQAIGTFTYGTEDWNGEEISTTQLAVNLMADRKVELDPLVTHRFRLDEYQKALATVTSKGSSGVIKAVFDFRENHKAS